MIREQSNNWKQYIITRYHEVHQIIIITSKKPVKWHSIGIKRKRKKKMKYVCLRDIYRI